MGPYSGRFSLLLEIVNQKNSFLHKIPMPYFQCLSQSPVESPRNISFWFTGGTPFSQTKKPIYIAYPSSSTSLCKDKFTTNQTLQSCVATYIQISLDIT